METAVITIQQKFGTQLHNIICKVRVQRAKDKLKTIILAHWLAFDEVLV